MDGLLTAFAFTLQPLPMLLMLIGVSAGVFVGAIPGLTGTMLLALCLPLTFFMTPQMAIVLLIAIYIGAISGGLITATLLKMPGHRSGHHDHAGRLSDGAGQAGLAGLWGWGSGRPSSAG